MLNIIWKFLHTKTFLNIGLAILLTPVFRFIQLYIYNDWDYLLYLGVLIVIDSLLGIYNAWLKHSISSKGFGQIITKVLIYGATLVTVHVIASFKIDGVHPTIISYGDNLIMTSLIVREAISIFENISIVYPGIIPAIILKRLKAFDSDTGEVLNDGDKNLTNGSNSTQK